MSISAAAMPILGQELSQPELGKFTGEIAGPTSVGSVLINSSR